MTTLLMLCALALVLSSFFAAAMHACTLRLLGVGIVEVRIGYGRSGLRLRWGSVPITISPWLFGSSVSAKDAQSESAAHDVPGRDVATIGRLRLALLGIAPFVTIVLLLSASPMVDLSDAAAMSAHTFQGALGPLSAAQSMIDDYVRLAETSPWETVCRLLMLLAVWNLLPIPPLPGGQALLTLVLGHVERWPRAAGITMSAGVMLSLAMIASWAFALYMYPHDLKGI